MTHVTPDVVRRWHDRALGGDEVVAISRHLEECEACARLLGDDALAAATARALDHALHGAPPREHLGFDELQEWVDGTGDDRARGRVVAHLASCASCRAEADDLAAFAAELPISRSRTWKRVAIGAGALAASLFAILLVMRSRPAPRAGLRPRANAVVATPANGPTPAVSPLQIVDGPLRFEVEPTGTIRGVPSRWHDEVLALVRRPELAPPPLARALAARPDAERGDDPAPLESGVTLIEPLGHASIEDRPTFRWRGPRGATYEVAIYDPHYRRLARSAALRGESWRPARPLPRGEVLVWVLDVTLPEGRRVRVPQPPAAPAMLAIVGDAAVGEIAAARASGSHLLTGLALWRAGLLDQGAAELAELARANPRSAFARQLARSSRAALDSLDQRSGEGPRLR